MTVDYVINDVLTFTGNSDVKSRYAWENLRFSNRRLILSNSSQSKRLHNRNNFQPAFSVFMLSNQDLAILRISKFLNEARPTTSESQLSPRSDQTLYFPRNSHLSNFQPQLPSQNAKTETPGCLSASEGPVLRTWVFPHSLVLFVFGSSIEDGVAVLDIIAFQPSVP